MDTNLQSNLLDRLQSEEDLPDKVPELVLAALLDEIEECLSGKPPSKPSPEPTEVEEPVRAYIDSITVQGFRGIGPKAELPLTPGPGLTLVVGRNGSGKSSFAEALELLLTGENQRWSSGRSKIWKEGWRNLHQPETAKIEASLLIDGQAGAFIASRQWSATDALEDSEATVTHDGNTGPIHQLGWQQPLAIYRPFLSYNELGSMLEDGPVQALRRSGVDLGSRRSRRRRRRAQTGSWSPQQIPQAHQRQAQGAPSVSRSTQR